MILDAPKMRFLLRLGVENQRNCELFNRATRSSERERVDRAPA
jgi:hypothetical protein